jgi:hypothetical protein
MQGLIWKGSLGLFGYMILLHGRLVPLDFERLREQHIRLSHLSPIEDYKYLIQVMISTSREADINDYTDEE